jgi:hypothetical protein
VAIVLRLASRLGGRLVRLAKAVAVVFALVAGPLLGAPSVHANDLPSPFLSGKFETWSGGEAARRSLAAYSGFSWAPFGTLAQSGLRLRAAGGYGQYSYDGVVDYAPRSIYGTTVFADLLVGYQTSLGRLTLKGFAGAAFDRHVLQPHDAASRLAQPATGVKLVVEAWYNVTEQIWAQTDLSWTSAHATYSGRGRMGYRISQGFMTDLSVGVEAGAFGNAAGDNGKAGLFARYAWYGGEISASAGVTGEVPAQGMSFSRWKNPYGTLVYLKRF